jgi:hypothetical protein
VNSGISLFLPQPHAAAFAVLVDEEQRDWSMIIEPRLFDRTALVSSGQSGSVPFDKADEDLAAIVADLPSQPPK